MAVFGAQHGGDLPQVGGVALLLHAAREGDGDDPLCDVDQVQLVALVQGLQQTHTPVGQAEALSLSSIATALSNFTIQRSHGAKAELRWAAGPQDRFRSLIPRSNTAHVIYTHVYQAS